MRRKFPTPKSDIISKMEPWWKSKQRSRESSDAVCQHTTLNSNFTCIVFVNSPSRHLLPFINCTVCIRSVATRCYVKHKNILHSASSWA